MFTISVNRYMKLSISRQVTINFDRTQYAMKVYMDLNGKILYLWLNSTVESLEDNVKFTLAKKNKS